MKGKALGMTALILLMALLVAGRMVYLQHSHFSQAEAYLKEGNRKLALREFDAAMHFYAPWSPYIERSARRLWEMGETFEKEGRPDWASMAYSSIRSSFYASRSLYTPGREWIARCDEKLASLNVLMLLREGALREDQAGAERQRHLYVMRADRAPSPLWAALAEGGFFLWVGAAALAILRGFDRGGSLRTGPALLGILIFALSFAFWVVALLKA